MNTLLVGLAIVIAAPAPKDAKKAEPPGLIGEWSLEAFQFMGMPLPKEKGDLKLEFTKEGTIIATKDGKPEKEPARFTHDPKKQPAEFDFTEGKDRKMSGIYKIEGDTLTLCLAPDGERPKSFDSAGMAIVMTFKRIKKD